MRTYIGQGFWAASQTRAPRVAAAQIVYMPTLAPTSTRMSFGLNSAIQSSVHGSLVEMVSTRHRVPVFGVEKIMRAPPCSSSQRGINFSYCSSVKFIAASGRRSDQYGTDSMYHDPAPGDLAARIPLHTACGKLVGVRAERIEDAESRGDQPQAPSRRLLQGRRGVSAVRAI